ncbi:MAG: hypothetical protein ACRD9W_15725, partial [Terriglobia bacterium]
MQHGKAVAIGLTRFNPSFELPGAPMGMIRLLAAPIRSIVRFPLFQLAFVLAIILLLQAASDSSAFGQLFSGLDNL